MSQTNDLRSLLMEARGKISYMLKNGKWNEPEALLVRIDQALEAQAATASAVVDTCLQAEAARFRASLEENLCDVLTDEMVESVMKTGASQCEKSLAFQADGGASRLFANAFANTLAEEEIVNYIEMHFDSEEHPEVGLITVTLKRESGRTAHELRVAAEEERDLLKAEVAELRAQLLASATAASGAYSPHHPMQPVVLDEQGQARSASRTEKSEREPNDTAAVNWIEHGPSRPCPFQSPYTALVDIRHRNGEEMIEILACNHSWFWYSHDRRDDDIVAYRITAPNAQAVQGGVA